MSIRCFICCCFFPKVAVFFSFALVFFGNVSLVFLENGWFFSLCFRELKWPLKMPAKMAVLRGKPVQMADGRSFPKMWVSEILAKKMAFFFLLPAVKNPGVFAEMAKMAVFL